MGGWVAREGMIGGHSKQLQATSCQLANRDRASRIGAGCDIYLIPHCQ